ncbi:hypothetical protein P5673_004756 [Acropora cervicornis]|uniref:DNA/RNA non-specific endonuclease domain-containing protein n=1 Tax=Acropora cervicornis TaxID=6130 RepID=A0AAD9VDK4_ACRCE|nr:hypothetical protein P5673_004756 [Acropora cervicornis]
MLTVKVFMMIAVLVTSATTASEDSNEVRRMLPATCSPDTPSPSFNKFFLDQQMPTGLFDVKSKTLRYICQTIPETPGVYYYSTLFDENTGIAVLSAYIVDPIQAKDISRQGSDALYYKSGLDKGHLNPVHINSFNKEYVKSTFTYTNAVPQYLGWNRGQWKVYEGYIADYVQSVCAKMFSGTMYLLTGTSHFHLEVGVDSPTQEGIGSIEPFPGPLNPNKIVRPNSMWTAGCCVWTEKGEDKAESIAVMGNNDSDKGKLGTTSMTLAELERILVDKKSADLFPGSLKKCREKSYLLKKVM